MTYLEYIELLDAQPVGTYLIFDEGYPMALKLRDGRWGIAIGYNLDGTITRSPLRSDGPAIWMDDKKSVYWLS